MANNPENHSFFHRQTQQDLANKLGSHSLDVWLATLEEPSMIVCLLDLLSGEELAEIANNNRFYYKLCFSIQDQARAQVAAYLNGDTMPRSYRS